MKKIYFSIVAILSTISLLAQYSADSSKPLGISIATREQTAVKVLPDNNDGHFVFWLDNRTTKKHLYAQHLTKDGIALWETDGRKLVGGDSATQAVANYAISAWQNGILIAWEQSTTGKADTIFCNYFDTDGAPIWDSATMIARAIGGSFIYMTSENFGVFPNDSGATITHSYVYTGGSSGFTYNRVDFNGKLHWPVLSKTTALQGYDYRACSDGDNGFFALSKGNGLGSGIYIQHFNMQGVASWGTGLNVAANGNGFSGNITLLPDGLGNLYVVWDASSNQVAISKVSAAGTFGWANKLVQLSDTSKYSPGRSSAILAGDTLYVTWQENRSAGTATSSVVQKLDTAGNELWIHGGIIAGGTNYYYAYPKLALSDSGSIVNTFQGSGNVDMTIQRIRPDGSLTWPGNGKVLASVSQAWASYSDYRVTDAADGCNKVFYSTGANVYGVDVCATRSIATGVNEVAATGEIFTVYPNPATSQLNITSQPGEKLMVTDITGRIVLQHTAERQLETLDISTLAPGMYLVHNSKNKAVKIVKE